MRERSLAGVSFVEPPADDLVTANDHAPDRHLSELKGPLRLRECFFHIVKIPVHRSLPFTFIILP